MRKGKGFFIQTSFILCTSQIVFCNIIMNTVMCKDLSNDFLF